MSPFAFSLLYIKIASSFKVSENLEISKLFTFEREIYKIIKEQNKTAILVTHDIAEAVSMGDKVVVLSSRPGEVKASIPIIFDNEYDSPFAARSAPEFSVYFNKIWKEIN